MYKNDIRLILLLLGTFFLLESCTLIRKSSGSKPSIPTIEDEFTSKGAYVDTTQIAEEEIIMPPAVDISDYKPGDAERFPEKYKSPDRNSLLILKKRNDIVSFSRKFLGTKYQYGGKTPNSGFDCSGFTAYIFKEYKIKLAGGSRYQAEQGVDIPIKKVQAGDLIFFGNAGKVSHVAVVSRNDRSGIYVVHSTNRGVVEDNIIVSTYWSKRILFAREVMFVP